MSGKVKIVVTGDTHLGGGRVRGLAQNQDADGLFGNFLPLIKRSDIAITNLESPIIDGGTPILKTGPNLKSGPDTLQVLNKAGFNLVTLANNHIMDYGSEGLSSTMEACKKAGIETVGAGKSLEEAAMPRVVEIQGVRISVINIAENEFGTTHNHSPGGNPLNPVKNYYAIREAKKNADIVIVIVHGGHEHYELPSPRMKETYRFFVDAGADAVIGHHTHCYSGYELYKGAPIFYSLGNFLFDMEGECKGETSWNTGFLVELEITDGKIDFEIQPYVQNGFEAGLRAMAPEEKVNFDKYLERLNGIISDDNELAMRFENYSESVNRMYNAYIEPHSIRILHALRNRNLFPSFLSRRKKRLLVNLARCEAHRDILIKTLEQ
jgi:hypothetical protein